MAIDEKDYFLACLAEEGVEVAQRVTKALRFGLDEVQPGQELNNSQRIIYEYADMAGVWELIVERGIFNDDLPDLGNLIALKKAKVLKYLEYAKSVGAVK